MKTTIQFVGVLAVVGLLAGLVGLLAGLVGLRAAEKKVDLTKLPPAAAKAGVKYAGDIQPLIERSCLKCHSGERPKGKYRVETLEGLIKGGGEGAAVTPGKIAESPMLHYAAGLVPDMEMPPMDKRDKFPALTKEQVGLLRAWIEQGAK